MKRSRRSSIPPKRLTYSMPSTPTKSSKSAPNSTHTSPTKEAALRVLKKALSREKVVKGLKSKCISLPSSPKKVAKISIKRQNFVFKPRRFGLTDEKLKQIQKARAEIIKAEKSGDDAIREVVAKTRQEIIVGNETASMQRNRTGRMVRHTNKVFVSHILVNTFNYNKLKPNDPVCNVKGQIYFDKVEAGNLRWKDIVNLKKRKLLTGKRHKRKGKGNKECSSSETSSVNGKVEPIQAPEISNHQPTAAETIQDNSDEEEL
ncbi:unnamed protein product, partial [Mesorhabditis belari]|uniref:Uncharacterized protein n=1 Tax=Mesorhabditis belari TaxID=2138241 RepID=A0AAF3F892_9BILA